MRQIRQVRATPAAVVIKNLIKYRCVIRFNLFIQIEYRVIYPSCPTRKTIVYSPQDWPIAPRLNVILKQRTLVNAKHETVRNIRELYYLQWRQPLWSGLLQKILCDSS